MGRKKRPKLVQFPSLTPAHFVEQPVWVNCHVIDYEEPWYDGTDEETFRPWLGDLPVDPASTIFLFRARFTSRDGLELSGFVSSVGEDAHPHVFLPSGRLVGFWLGGLMDRGPRERAALSSELGKDHADIFPIRFTVEEGLARGLKSGVVADFAGLDSRGRRRTLGR